MVNLLDLAPTTIQDIIDTMPGNVYIKNSDGVTLYCNLELLRNNGWKKSDIIGRTDKEISPPEIAEQIACFDKEVLDIKKTISREEISHNGKVYISKKTPIIDKSGTAIGLIGVSFDVTERKFKEKAIQSEQNKTKITLDYIINSIPCHVFWQDLNMRFLGCNQLHALTAGFGSPENIIGKTNFELLPKEEAEKIVAANREVLESGKELMLEEEAIIKGENRTFLSKKVPMHDKNGEVIGLLGIAFDITTEKEASKLEKEKALAESKSETSKKIAAIVAHELRTPLATIKFAADYLSETLSASINLDCPDRDSILKVPLTLNRTCQQANLFIDMQLIKTKIDYDKFATQVLSINKVISEAIDTYPLQSHQNHLIHFDKSDDFTVIGNQTYLNHVFYNLLKNSLYFIDNTGKGQVFIWLEKNGSTGEIHFKDTAKGIPANTLPKIFDDFMSSENKHGTGIGLSFCKEVIEKHSGTITCNSKSGMYTHFIISLPVHSN